MKSQSFLYFLLWCFFFHLCRSVCSKAYNHNTLSHTGNTRKPHCTNWFFAHRFHRHFQQYANSQREGTRTLDIWNLQLQRSHKVCSGSFGLNRVALPTTCAMMTDRVSVLFARFCRLVNKSSPSAVRTRLTDWADGVLPFTEWRTVVQDKWENLPTTWKQRWSNASTLDLVLAFKETNVQGLGKPAV